MITVEERERLCAEAAALHGEGYNCAQCVMMAVAPLVGADAAEASRMAAAFGAGVAGLGEVCGVVSGMSMAAGMLNPSGPRSKIAAIRIARPMAMRFIDENGGRVRCRDLKGQPGCKSCDELIRQGVGIVCDALNAAEAEEA